MSPSTTPRTARLTAGLLGVGLLVAPLSACSFSSDNVSCTTSGCSVTLSGDGAKAEVLGTTVTFAGTENGRASIGVAGADVSCGEGEQVTAGPLSLTCTSVTDDGVELTASLT
jgi:hypothetical protein